MDKIIIDLDGPDGNIFFLLGTMKKLAKMRGIDHKVIENEIVNTDYTKGIEIIEKYFGDLITFINK